ncbi:stalk domain-containing protein [Paenibacillus gorillae]|uniref:stalk domain-containing protein n=1 Tax=Paenibacillus gorillae TaxID=1243662 RepID=UPI0004AD1E9E|nr:stalk domain-containing protein [Paenibacillus gorillae]
MRKIKKATVTLLTTALLVLSGLPGQIFANDEAGSSSSIPAAALNEQNAVSDEEATIIRGGLLKNDRLLIPVRVVTENLGAKVNWNAASKPVTISKDEVEVVLTLGSKTALVNQMPITLDVAAEEKNGGTTYVPLRFLSQALGADISWDQKAGQATVQLNGQSLVIIPDKPPVQIPNEKRLTARQQQIIADKLNEATNLSSIKQIRTYFSPYFTDRFINTIIQNKGLQYKNQLKDVTPSALQYIDNQTATLTQYVFISSDYETETYLHRKATLTYTGKTWKVDSVDFKLEEYNLRP